MAVFGKKAKLPCQKSTVKVECLVSVYETVFGPDGEPERYKVVVQRLQDGVSMSDAEAGLADAMPYITNRKQWIRDDDGNASAKYSHDDYVSPAMMDAIRRVAPNCHMTSAKVEDADGSVSEISIENYCVKLDIGFDLGKGEAFFYRIKAGVNADSLAKDVKYNLRHMPAAGRKLTEEIIAGHKEVTDVARRVYKDAMSLGKSGEENPQR